MKIKTIPCAECRKHRRKCLRLESKSICSRCERLGKICEVNDNDQDEEDPDMKQLQTQVQELESTIQQLDVQLQGLRLQSSNRQLQSLVQDPMVRNLMYNWKCKIENGTFQIETGIKNIQDLMHLRNPPLYYLSPFSSHTSSDFDSDTSSTIASENMYLGATSFVMNFGQDKEKKSLVSIMANFFNQAMHNNRRTANLLSDQTLTSENLLLPPTLISTPSNLVEEFINVYFLCHNSYNPMLHEASFRERVSMLADSLEDLMTLSVCAYVCTKPCYHISYTPREIRNMADFFYGKAKSLLMDQFDDVDKRLENIISISFLVRYCHMTLKFVECRQIVTIAYELCLDLREVYFEDPPTRTSTCFNEKMHAYKGNPTDVFRNEQPEKVSTNVDQELYHRHIFFIIVANRIMDYLTKGYLHDNCYHYPSWGYLYDESESTKRYIFGRNWLSRFHNHPFVQAFSKQIQNIRLGGVSAISFEAIIRMEDIIAEWIQYMPAEIRICNNFNDVDQCKKAIDQTTDATMLLNFAQYTAYVMSIYYAFLQPSNTEYGKNDQLLTYVQQHSLQKALQVCDLLLHCIRRIANIKDNAQCRYMLTVTEYLFNAIDALALLSMSPNQHIAKEACTMLKTCFIELNSIKTMQECQVPVHASPLVYKLFHPDTFIDLDLEYYDQYPQPWYALMYDLTHSVVHA